MTALHTTRCVAQPHRRVCQSRFTRRPVICVASARSSAGAGDAAKSGPLVTLDEVQRAARRRGLDITVKDLGPFYRVVVRDGGPEGKVVGVTTGFVAPPFGLMHCDTLQIFTKGIKGEEGQRVRGGALGLGLLMGGATFAYGNAAGCRTAEILAINDDEHTHARLVKYYSYFGFKPVRTVGGNGLSDLPHLLVWGGEGTRMDADIRAMLRRWTPALRQSAAGEGAEGKEQAAGEGDVGAGGKEGGEEARDAAGRGTAAASR
ncbi:hypothetical protein HYH03_005993 [Edaphochlamys debaryana]|uniref:Uncharacterized protein n=1 Tax=Edaphochlamys debaryana TaxID=47281 RepID=A0A836C208_9CHLO|nr:hypothetical protein HYH03_005993 [Edaphochlamys debaryana]|eukprot:KAG2496074.1 hypothetical protein HYH03_005993 [Edaphochlamys debaryana]